MIMPKNDLTVRPEDNEYALLQPETMQHMLTVFQENLGTAGAASLDLPRIKAPSGGSLLWSIQTLDGEETAKQIEGIVLAWRPGRLYWAKARNEGGGKKPPDCISRDGFTGVGNPGGECNLCPFAKFGSSPKGGRGQACKQVRQLLLVRPGEVLPSLIAVPPTSLRAASQYFLMLASRQLSFWTVSTKISLEKASNEDGIEYARMTFRLGRLLSADEQRLLRPYQERMRSILNPLALDAADYEDGAAEEESGGAPDAAGGQTPGKTRDQEEEIAF